MSLIQKSSNFALGTCSNCNSPVFSCGVERYPLINHIYIIKKIRVFCTNIFGAKILWALLKVRGLLRLTFFPWILKGDPKRYRVTQWVTGWLSELQGDPKRYRVTQWDTGWPKKIQGDSYSKRVTLWGTGWHNKATNWCNFVCLCGEIHASWHASMACYSFKIFQASQAEEFDLLQNLSG